MAPSKCILLNAGDSAANAFVSGFSDTTLVERYRTKKILLHIGKEGIPTYYHDGKPLDFSKAYVFVRLRGTDAHFCAMLSEYCKHAHIPTNDPVHRSHGQSAGKITQMLLLALNHILIPETLIFREESFEANRAYIETWAQFPLIFKTDGRKGREVYLVHSFTELEECVRAKKPNKLALIQPFIENTFDTRTLVAYGEVLGTIKRSRMHGHLNNISQGGVAAPYALTEEEKRVALKAAEICKIDFGGVDMIHTDAGPVVLEVNKSPQVRGFDSVYKGNVLGDVARIIEKNFLSK